MTKNEIFACYPEISRFLNREIYIRIDSLEECEELGRIFDNIKVYWRSGDSLRHPIGFRPPFAIAWDYRGYHEEVYRRYGKGVGGTDDIDFYRRNTPHIPIISWKDIRDTGRAFYWR